MDLNQIAVFVRVIESGSITKAAQLLRQPKSRVSRKIAALERELGVTLLYRTTRQFSPTDAGRALYHQCRQQVYDLEAAAQSLQEDAREVSGVLKITTTEDMGTALLGPVIDELTSMHPRLCVHLHLADSVVDLVKEGIDVAIRFGELKDTTLKARSLGKAAFVLVASPTYLARAPRIEALTDLTSHPALIFGPDGDENRWKLRSSSRKEESVKLKAHIRSNSPRVLLQLAMAGKGVALIPEFLCRDALSDGRLERILSDYATRSLPVNFVWHSKREASPNVRAFVDLGLKRLARYFS